MNKSFLSFSRSILFVLTLFFLIGCESKTKVEIICHPSVLHFPFAGGEQTVSLATQSPWSATCDVDWVSFTPTTGLGSSYVKVSVSEGEFAEAHLLFTIGNESNILTIYRGEDELIMSDSYIKMEQGDTAKLFAHLLSENECTPVWQSTNPEVAIVNQDGLVTAIAPGFTDIIAKVDSIMSSCLVEVRKPIIPVTFDIQVANITTTTATVTVTPTDDNEYYLYDIISLDNYNKYESDSLMADDVLKTYIEMIEEASLYGYNISLTNEVLSKGPDSYNYTDLCGSTQYYAFAVAVDVNSKKIKGKIIRVPFRTADVEDVTLAFTTQTTDTAVWFLPNNDEITYLPLYVDADSLNGYTISEYYQAYWEHIETMASMYGMTLDDLVAYGPVYILYDELEAGHNYIFAASAYTAGTWNSSLCQVQFTATVPNNAPAKINQMDFSKQMRMKKAKKINSFIGGKNTYQKR